MKRSYLNLLCRKLFIHIPVRREQPQKKFLHSKKKTIEYFIQMYITSAWYSTTQ